MKNKTPTQHATPITRTSAGLRDALFDELDALRDGSGNPTRANAVAKLADQVVNTVKMELEVQRHVAKHKPSTAGADALAFPLALGA